MTIHSTAVIYPCVTIEPGAYIGPLCVIGAPPEHLDAQGAGHGVLIKAGARLEKAVVVDSGLNEKTVIGSNSMLMSQVHIGHDCQIGDNVVIAAGATFAGHCIVLKGAYIGINASIHQYQKIGHYALVGAGSVVTKKVRVHSGCIVAGNPATQIKMNTIGLQRAGITADQLRVLQDEFDMLCQE